MAAPARLKKHSPAPPVRQRPPRRAGTTPRLVILVCITALVAAFSSVAYELLLASYASFLLGASVFQYSLVISLMMASMGVGALIAQSLKSRFAPWIAGIEFAIAICAGSAIPILYALFATGGPAQVAVLFFVCVMGVALGMEIPLLNHMGKDNRWLADILFYDYLGGFLGGMLFPLLLLPSLGFFRLAALLGCANAAVGLAFVWTARREFRHPALWVGVGSVSLTFCLFALGYAETLRLQMETGFFGVTQ